MAQPRTDRPESAMKLRHLEYLVAAAEELNFTHAADRLHVSQPLSASKSKTWRPSWASTCSSENEREWH